MKFKHLLKQICSVAMTGIFVCIGASCNMTPNTNNEQTLTSSTTQPNDATNMVKTEEFSISDYQWGITEFPANEVLSKIENVEDLIEKGKQLWREKLNFYPKEEHIIKTYYDSQNDCWMVTAEIDDAETDYAVPTAIIRANGTVVAVWME